MKTDKTKLLQDIEAMKEKLASMEEELNKPEVFKHFPSKDDYYYFYTSIGVIHSNTAADDGWRVNTYKTEKEAQKAYNKAVAVEKVKRRLLELQGDWKPNWRNGDERKIYIRYNHRTDTLIFEPGILNFLQSFQYLPYIKDIKTALTIIKEMEDELKLIFGIA